MSGRLPAPDCHALADIRTGIDDIDQQVIRLLGERFGYVKAAARFKHDADAVRAPQRLQQMLAQRREWATQAGLSADVIEALYRQLVDYFIAEELRHWQGS
ncbi:isochorismate lyase [Vogesella sp. LIG4]|uniref:isochorismate lyase n=1 Tax=Vogesella sp. LIG4 TaxID=1192162 RepID=UPI00081F9A8D|nr:isochorismate lyase [Vogesella sp. LIG4]SCK06613.1 isochorismate pyruvate lyase [Vogesella sp. LIG4]